MLAFLFCLLLVLCTSNHSIYNILSINKLDVPDVDIIFGSDYTNYTITVDGQTWLQSGTTSFNNNNKWQTLKVLNTYNASGADSFGIYYEFGVIYVDSTNTQFITAFLIYLNNPNIIQFKQIFPNGTTNSNNSDVNSVISSFPSFLLTSLNGNNLGFMHFGGFMCAGAYNQMGLFNQQNTNLNGGLEFSGPLALFNGTNSLVISSLTNHMSMSDAVMKDNLNRKEIRYGIQGGINNIEKGFETSFILINSRKLGGPNVGMNTWGDAMLKYYNKDRENSWNKDYTLNYLGYSTDNGAYYYYYTEPNKNYQETMIDIKKYHDKVGLPTKYVLLDSWWYYKGKNGGVKDWSARPDIFPDGLDYVYQQTDWKIQAHNRYWSLDNIYASNIPNTTNNGTNLYPFTWSNYDALPTTSEFWQYLFKINNNWGLIVYEQDWLSTTESTIELIQNTTTFGQEWLLQMGNNALDNNLCIQYCMSYTRHILTSAMIQSVTQARASDDYHPGNGQWNVGISGILAHALGIGPSKDSYWSMSTPQTSGYGDNTTEPFNRLQSLVLSLSNGPVTFSDQIGFSDVDLIMKCCNNDGLLLRPDQSATLIDSAFYKQTGLKINGNIYGPTGNVWATFSDIGNSQIFRYLYVFAVNLVSDYSLTRQDLNYYINDDENDLEWLAYENNSTSKYYKFDNNNPLTLNKCNQYNFQYYTFIPVNPQAPNAWYLQGEINKWIKASKQRFLSINTIDSYGSIQVIIKGDVNEKVQIAFVKPVTMEQQIVNCIIDESFVATIVCHSDENCSC